MRSTLAILLFTAGTLHGSDSTLRITTLADPAARKGVADYLTAAPKLEIRTREDREWEAARLKREEEDRKKRREEAARKKREKEEEEAKQRRAGARRKSRG
ncbi:MAG TPA: hypothetical protein VMT52_11780 [Planctomycetota bacterium]|nr:hypothetical protein [Planctomycetota bacterium]